MFIWIVGGCLFKFRFGLLGLVILVELRCIICGVIGFFKYVFMLVIGSLNGFVLNLGFSFLLYLNLLNSNCNDVILELLNGGVFFIV